MDAVWTWVEQVPPLLGIILLTLLPALELRWRAFCRAQATVPDEQWLCELSASCAARAGCLTAWHCTGAG